MSWLVYLSKHSVGNWLSLCKQHGYAPEGGGSRRGKVPILQKAACIKISTKSTR